MDSRSNSVTLPVVYPVTPMPTPSGSTYSAPTLKPSAAGVCSSFFTSEALNR
ncbi:MAG TPA: hypothetical protein VGB24_16660 [Longimicrobium sp.]|uniref:hypothetical protein n=1 Tax=Longimicrobium sp. TaxID=2029185 RepID=UPI002ED8A6DF